MTSTLTLRRGLPVPSVAHNGERPLSHIAPNQRITAIYSRAKRGLGIPADLGPLAEVSMPYSPLCRKAQQMVYVLLEAHIPDAYFCTAFGKREESRCMRRYAWEAHQLSMQEENYQRTYEELATVIAVELG